MLFDKYNYIENDLKKQLKSTVSRLDQLENLFHLNFRPAGSQINQIPEQRPYYVNYQVPYQQIPNNMNNLDSGVYLNKPTNYMSFGQSKISNERPEIKPVNYDFLSRNPNNPTANNNEINYNEGFYLNNQAMKLENILNTNYLTFSPSKKQGLEEKDLENKTIESVLQRTPKKTINL